MTPHEHARELLHLAAVLAGFTAPADAREDIAARRSVSTAYYALFHYLAAETSELLVGREPALLARCRTLERVLAHGGLKQALGKVTGSNVDPAVADLLCPPGQVSKAVRVPVFVRQMARTFSDAQAARHEADYNWNATITLQEARLWCLRVTDAMIAWHEADSPADRDFKHALALLMLLRGRLRPD